MGENQDGGTTIKVYRFFAYDVTNSKTLSLRSKEDLSMLKTCDVAANARGQLVVEKLPLPLILCMSVFEFVTSYAENL